MSSKKHYKSSSWRNCNSSFCCWQGTFLVFALLILFLSIVALEVSAIFLPVFLLDIGNISYKIRTLGYESNAGQQS